MAQLLPGAMPIHRWHWPSWPVARPASLVLQRSRTGRAPPAGEADLIALHFLRALKRPGTTLGAAFMAGRIGMIQDTIALQSMLDEDDQKTLLEFVLYGDPTLMVTA